MSRQDCLQLEVETRLPQGEQWLDCVSTLRGGFFQTPLAVPLTLPPGAPLYLTWYAGDEVVGVAVGVRRQCRLGGTHVQLASAPALATHVDMRSALTTLAAGLKLRGAAEVDVASFDSPLPLPSIGGAIEHSPRLEYVVPLDGAEGDPSHRFASTTRRHLRAGARGDWAFRALASSEAAAVLLAVQSTAAARSRARGSGYEANSMTAAAAASLAQRGVSRDGAAVFAAESDGRLLAAILVGWGARRAFYLRGGSTDEGYRQNAAVWLHWRVMNVLRERGITAYNLGGTPEGARLPEHGQHGLYRFKVGLGAEQVATAGLRITLRRRHVALHRVVARLKRARAGEEAMAEAHL